MLTNMKQVLVTLSRYPALLLLGATAGAWLLLTKLGYLPEDTYLVRQMHTLHESYGLLALFISSLIEGFLFVGLYYIGTAFIILAVVVADGHLPSILAIIVTVWSALTIMSVVNFTIGKYGWLRMNTPPLLTGYLARYLSVTLYLHPTLIAYQAYTRGQTGQSYRTLIPLSAGIFLAGVFYSVIITLIASSTKYWFG